MKRPLISIVFGTKNDRKVKAVQNLLQDLPLLILSPAHVLNDPWTVPAGIEGFEQQARARVTHVARRTGYVSMVDVTGLEVDALAGRPGTRSAAYAHERATDAENNAALLRDLEEVEEAKRTARFRTVIALRSPWSEDVAIVEGVCPGRIARTPRGSGGFGYDPLFVVDGRDGRSMAELSEAEQSTVSHRTLAVQNLRQPLQALLTTVAEDVERAAAGRSD